MPDTAARRTGVLWLSKTVFTVGLAAATIFVVGDGAATQVKARGARHAG